MSASATSVGDLSRLHRALDEVHGVGATRRRAVCGSRHTRVATRGRVATGAGAGVETSVSPLALSTGARRRGPGAPAKGVRDPGPRRSRAPLMRRARQPARRRRRPGARPGFQHGEEDFFDAAGQRRAHFLRQIRRGRGALHVQKVARRSRAERRRPRQALVEHQSQRVEIACARPMVACASTVSGAHVPQACPRSGCWSPGPRRGPWRPRSLMTFT